MAFKLVLGGTETPQGRRSRSRATPSRRAPERTRSVTPSRGRDTGRKKLQCTEVTVLVPGLQNDHNCSCYLDGKESPERRFRAPELPRQAIPECHAGRFQRRVGPYSCKSRFEDHRCDLGFGLETLAGRLRVTRRKHDRPPESGSIDPRDCIRRRLSALGRGDAPLHRARNAVRSPRLCRSVT